jgi:hypothetical protein
MRELLDAGSGRPYSCPANQPAPKKSGVVCAAGKGEEHATVRSGIHRYVLVGPWRMWKRGSGCGIPWRRHRLAWRVPGLRSNGPDHGLCHWSHFRLPPQSRGVRGAVGGWPLSRETTVPVHRRASDWGCGCGGVLYLIASCKPGFELAAGFASNGWGSHSRRSGWRRWCAPCLAREPIGSSARRKNSPCPRAHNMSVCACTNQQHRR